MNFLEHTVKGLARCLVDQDLRPEQLHLHISEIGPGERAHPPHTHDGVEALYVLEGQGTIEIDGQQKALGPGEAAVFDPTKLHGLLNSGATPMRYMVVIAREAAGA